MQHKHRLLSLLLGTAALLIPYGPAVSQETPHSESADTTSVLDQVIVLEELVVIGSRAKPRSVVESAVPVDVVSGAEIAKQGEADLQNLVRTVVRRVAGNAAFRKRGYDVCPRPGDRPRRIGGHRLPGKTAFRRRIGRSRRRGQRRRDRQTRRSRLKGAKSGENGCPFLQCQHPAHQ